MKRYLLVAVAVFCSLCAASAHPLCTGPASISGRDTVCAGAEILLTDSTSGGTWSSSDTTRATIGPVTGVVTGIYGGTTTITYTISPGCYVTKLLVVNAILPVIGDTALCVGSGGIYSDLTTGGTWTSSNTSVATIGASSGAAYGVASGNTIISYSLANGCSRRLILAVNPLPPNYYVFGGGIYCEGTSGATIGLNGSDVGINYRLYRNDTAFVDSLDGTGSAIFYGPISPPGIYSIIAVNLTTGCSKRMSGITSIGITPLNIPSVTITTATDDTVCIAAATTFTAVPVNGGTSPAYQWAVNGTPITGAPGSGVTFSYVPANGDVVSVTLFSNAVCAIPSTASASKTIVTIPRVIPSVSLSVAPGDSVCLFIPVTLIPAPVNGGPSPNYRWIKNGYTAAVSPSFTYLPANGDNILCVIYSNYQCLLTDSAYSTNNINVTVLPLLIPTVTVTANPGTTIAVGDYDTLAAVVINGGSWLSYQWEINGIPVPGATSDTFISNTFADNDTVTCVVTSPEFCDGLPASAYVVITDTINTVAVQPVMQQPGDLKLFPDPNNGSFTIAGTFGTISPTATLEIADMMGQSVYKEKISLQRGVLRASISIGNEVANGIYLVHVYANGVSTFKRVVISR